MNAVRRFSTACIRLAKKGDVEEIRLYFGRPSNNLSLGLVGLANVGKSTLFQAFTRSKLGNPANYPFATIEPEKSMMLVPLEKLEHYQSLFGSEKQVPSTLIVYDIAGLTRNASSGQGLGNKFLSDIRQVDGIFQVVRGFRDDDIIHIENNVVDPIRDLVIVNDELILKDLEYIETGLELVNKMYKKPQANKAVLDFEKDLLERIQDLLYEGKKIASVETWTAEEIETINTYNFLTAKPTVFLLNVSESDYLLQTNEFVEKVEEWIGANCGGDKLVMVSAEYETKIAESLEEEDLQNAPQNGLQENFIETLSETVGQSALPSIVTQMRNALHLISFFTCGPKEAHQWTIRQGSTAPHAAGVIHTDLQKTFVSALVYKWADLKQESCPLNEAHIKSTGKQYRHGKKYIVEDGDVLIIKAAGGKSR